MRYGLLLLILPIAGCADADTDKVRRVGEKTYDRLAQMASETWDELGRTLLDHTVKEEATPDVKTRVEQRLKWDTALSQHRITVTVHEEEITLTGSIATEELKQKAEQLATQTLGVTKVINDLQVPKKESDDKQE
jgi:hypothetical protein